MLAALSAFAWVGCAAAPLTLPAAIRLALEQPALRAPAHAAAAQQALAAQAGRPPNPELAWLREGGPADTRTTTIQLSQTIEPGGKRRARVQLAEGAAALADGELAARRQERRADVTDGWHAMLAAQRRADLAGSLAGLARRSVELAARRVQAGKASPLDETRARLAAADAAAELQQAGAALALARQRLALLTGMAADAIEPLAPADSLPALAPLDLLLARAPAAAGVARARSRLALQQAQADVERAARLPDLTLSVGARREGDAGRRQAVLGLSLPLPLFNRNEGNLRAALLRTEQARDELAAAQADAGADLAGAWTRCDAARREAALLRQEVLPQAAAAYELTLKGFEYGKFSILEVLDAQRTWFQAQSREAAALLEAWRAHAEIERLAGPLDATE